MTIQLVKVPLLLYENNFDDGFEVKDWIRGVETFADRHNLGTFNLESEIDLGLFGRFGLMDNLSNQQTCSSRGHDFESKVLLHLSGGNARHFEHLGWSILNRKSSIPSRSNRFGSPYAS